MLPDRKHHAYRNVSDARKEIKELWAEVDKLRKTCLVFMTQKEEWLTRRSVFNNEIASLRTMNIELRKKARRDVRVIAEKDTKIEILEIANRQLLTHFRDAKARITKLELTILEGA